MPTEDKSECAQISKQMGPQKARNGKSVFGSSASKTMLFPGEPKHIGKYLDAFEKVTL
jgi:hypothetical protein